MSQFWHIPPGHPGQHNRARDKFRRTVRVAARRFCDNPAIVHVEDECEMVESCENCRACEALNLVLAGKV